MVVSKRPGKVVPDAMGFVSPPKPISCLYLDVGPEGLDWRERGEIR